MQKSQWSADLQALGFEDPLPAPSPAVQATLVGLQASSLHENIQTQDKIGLADVDEDGEHAPLLLTTLDISQWTAILMTGEVDKTLAMLQDAHSKLVHILELETVELQKALKDSTSIEDAIRKVNPTEQWRSVPTTSLADSSPKRAHPLLARLNIAEAHKAALEDLSSSIQNSQTEKDMQVLISSRRGPSVPIMPHRSVEDQVAHKDHRVWGLNNINLLARITIAMWKHWIDLSKHDIETLKTNAVNGSGILRDPVDVMNAFPLCMFDPNKCSTVEVRIHTKGDLQTGYNRSEKHSSELWNIQRPYFRCSCDGNAHTGCKRFVIWFYHAVWFMLNHLDRFFGMEYPSLATKYGAFAVWMSDAVGLAVRHQVSSAHARTLMIEAALEFAADPNAKLLSSHADAPGLRKIEGLVKPASFSIANPGTPSSCPRNMRSKLMNLNVSPEPTQGRGGDHRMRGLGRGGHRGMRA